MTDAVSMLNGFTFDFLVHILLRQAHLTVRQY